MSSFSKQEELINSLKKTKNNIMNQEETVRLRIAEHYSQLRNIIDSVEKQTEVSLNQQGLQFYQLCGSIIEKLTRKSCSNDQEIVQQARELMQYRISDSPGIGVEKLSKIIKKSFEVTISNHPSQQCNNIIKNLLQQSQTNTQTHNMNQIVIQKLQCQRDYYQRRQSELQQRIKQLESGLHKRGVNIKQMSRSYLEEKCSKWALERLTEEKKILVERIGQASQEILRLNTEIGDLQHEIKKLTGTAYDGNSRSMVGNSSIKINSMVEQTRQYQRILESQERREREAELQLKNEQLIIEVTRCMRQIEELSELNNNYETKIEQTDQQLQQLSEMISTLKQSNDNLNHDYELSLKRKAAFEQQLKKVREQLQKANESMTQERQAYKTMISELQHRQDEVVQKVKQIQKTKKQDNEKYEQKIRGLLQQKEKALKMIEEISAKKGEEINYKALLNDQITRLHKENNNLNQEISLKEQKTFDDNTTIKKMIAQIKELEGKIQKSKKQNTKLKKHNKELEKQMAQLQKVIETKDNLEIKAAHIQQNYHILVSEFNKYKESTERRYNIQERTISHLKQKFSFQMTALLNDEPKGKTKKNQRIQIIEKYIEEMNSLSAKTSQIKQLKEEIRQLKEGKEQKSQSKKARTGSTVEETVSSLQAGIITLGTTLMNERIKAEKDINQESLKELQEVISKYQVETKTLQEQLQKQKHLISELKKNQKQQSISEDKTKQIRQKQQKIDRLQLQLKISRSNCIKLQNENTELQSQLKTKKDLAIALKKDNKEKDELIRQIKRELTMTQDDLDKIKRNQKEANKKEVMFKDYKEKKEQVKEENVLLKKNIENLEDKVKLLTKQITKKDQALREIRQSQERELKVKEEGKLKEAYKQITSQKDIIRKIKMEVQRKDDIIKNIREKAEGKVRELQDRAISKEKQSERQKKDIQHYERKIESTKSHFKKEQNKNYILSLTIKKIYELCINLAKEEQPRSSNYHSSIQNYNATTVTPHQVKSNTTASQLFRSNDICQGLRILDLKPQDLEGLLGQTTIVSKGTNQQQNSWSMVSPITCKLTQTARQQHLISGLEQLEKQLNQKELNSGSIVQLFKRVLIVQ